MPNIEITAAEWTQTIDGNRFIRRHGDVCSVTEAEAKRLVGIGAAKATRRKVTVEDQETTKAKAAVEDDPVAELEDTAEEIAPAAEVEKPADTATEKKWQEYAIAQGMAADEAEAMSRDELRAFYASA